MREGEKEGRAEREKGTEKGGEGAGDCCSHGAHLKYLVLLREFELSKHIK